MKQQQKQCIVCKKEFTDKSYNHEAKFCSEKCKIFYHYHKDIEKSRKRFRDWREKNRDREIKRAKDYHRNQYDNNPEYVLKRRNQAKQWRINNPDKVWERHNKEHFNGNKLLVLERDNFTCQICDYVGKDKYDTNIAIHHIDRNRNNNELENLITLCDKCHKYFTNLQQFISFYESNQEKKELIDDLIKKTKGEDIVRTVR